MERPDRGVQSTHGSGGLVVAPPRLRCAGCGEVLPPDAPYPFRCPRAGSGDDRDHVIAPEHPPGERAGAATAMHSEGARSGRSWVRDARSDHPFLRYRDRLWSHALAMSRGMSDSEFVERVEALDAAAAALDDRGLRLTPMTAPAALQARLAPPGGVIRVKDETGQLGGSHKARHLFGLLLTLEVLERTGLTTRAESDRRGLAIASCGNAALAAAILARAGGRPLRVFIPPDAEAGIVRQLRALSAGVVICARAAGEAGDPCLHAFRAAVREGALPFCCQGSENGLTLDGGRTIGFEIAEVFAREARPLDRLFVQVGGGALASSCVQGLREAVELGAMPRLPRVHAVQTESGWPLRRAWERITASIRSGTGAAEALEHARSHRSRYMWPWETAPASVAHGILDDETYDWLAIVAGMLESGGGPLTVSESRLREAHALARETTPIRADATGTAGLAGLIELHETGGIGAGESLAVLFTGAER